MAKTPCCGTHELRVNASCVLQFAEQMTS